MKPPKKPRRTKGLAVREQGALEGGPIGSMHVRVARSALKRQQLVAADEPAVPGSLRPSEIRARAKGNRPEVVTFAPSERQQRRKTTRYGG